jgi:long-chain acyl-CoA synthetase
VSCWQLGAPLLPVDIATPPSDIAALTRRFGARCAVVPAASRHAVFPTATADTASGPVLLDGFAFTPTDAVMPSAMHDAVLLKLTSGSTGEPKAVITTESQLLADTDHIVSAMGITAEDVQLAVIPLSHAYGFGNLIMPMLVQGTAIALRESFVPPQLLIDARRYGARVFQGVPFMYQHYLSAVSSDEWPPQLTLLVSAGAPLERETVQAFHRRFGIKIHSFYGASESGGMTFDGDDIVDDLPTVGRPLPGVTVALRSDPDIPSGCGRVHVSGREVSAAYVGEPSGNGAFEGGGFLTGDYGYFAPDGRLVLSGRVSSFINVAGRKVHPSEVEHVLRELAGVRDVQVLAAADASRGEQIAAVIVTGTTRAGGATSGSALTLSAVRAHCSKRLPAYKVPRIVVFVDALPLTGRGKVDRRALDALVAEHALAR